MDRNLTKTLRSNYSDYNHFSFIICVFFGLLIAGCTTSKTITPPTTENPIEIDGDLSDWPHGDALLKEGNFFNYYAMHDSTNLYVYINLKNAQYKRLIEDNGLTIYLSADKKNKKSFGLTYPVGAYNFLKQMPGTYQEFKQNRKWAQKPKNQKLLEKLRTDNYDKTMITQRDSKEDTPQEVIIDLSRLEAQGIELAREQLHNRLQLELRIPLESSPTQQFAIIPNKDRKIHLGFAITPPEKQWEQGSTTVDLSQRRSNRDPYGRRRSDQQMEERLSQLTDSYDAWFSLDLSK